MIKQVFAEYPPAQGLITATDGNIYSMPNINDCYHCRDPRKLWINKPWLDALGLAMPKTTDEFEACYQGVQGAGPERQRRRRRDPADVRDRQPGSASSAPSATAPMARSTPTSWARSSTTPASRGWC